MKKLLFVLLIGFLGILISCTPNPIKERNVTGIVIGVSEASLNDFNGNFIIWNQIKEANNGLGGSYQTWFIYPAQEFPEKPFTLKLTYKWTQAVSGIPIVRVVNFNIIK